MNKYTQLQSEIKTNLKYQDKWTDIKILRGISDFCVHLSTEVNAVYVEVPEQHFDRWLKSFQNANNKKVSCRYLDKK